MHNLRVVASSCDDTLTSSYGSWNFLRQLLRPTAACRPPRRPSGCSQSIQCIYEATETKGPSRTRSSAGPSARRGCAARRAAVVLLAGIQRQRQAGSTHAVVSSRAGALARFRAAVVCLVSSRPAASPSNQRCDHRGSGRTPYTSHRRAPCQGISEAVLGG